jgi:hypothetical protein
MSKRYAGWLLSLSMAFCVTACSHPKTSQSGVNTMALALPPMRPASSCESKDGLPDSSCTPGKTRTTDVNEICHGGSTKQFRPHTSYTNKLKAQQIAEYGYAYTNLGDYEEDHLISLELGGDGSDALNLWPESHSGKYNSFVKDQIENWLHKQICSGAMTPKQAQEGIRTDWRQYIPDALGAKASKIENE